MTGQDKKQPYESSIDALEKLAGALKTLPSLTYFGLRGSYISSSGLDKLSDSLGALSFLRVLDLSYNPMSTDGVEIIARILKAKDLHDAYGLQVG